MALSILLLARVGDASAQVSAASESLAAISSEGAGHWSRSATVPLADATPARQTHSTYWLTAGVGAGTRGLAGVAGAAYQFGGNLLAARGSGTVAFFGDPLWDIGVLYGRATRPGFVHLSVAAGIAAVGGERREGSLFDPPERIPTTVGFPFQAELTFRLPVLGVGLIGFGNVNQEESFGGVAAAIQIGRVH